MPAINCLAAIAQETFKKIPLHLQDKALKIHIIVDNYADEQTLSSLKIKDKYELLGLYRGTPIPIKAFINHFECQDSIFLYRCPIIRYSIENQESIENLVEQVMLHELGHHFGYNERDPLFTN
jgi:predicted Zn-dependent protease with MMP-like domain